MTVRRFDAPASMSPARRFTLLPSLKRGGVAFRIVRLVWLTARFTRHEQVTIDDYRRRFGVSLRSFRRDIALLREAGLYIDPATHGSYRMLCFLADADQISLIWPAQFAAKGAYAFSITDELIYTVVHANCR